MLALAKRKLKLMLPLFHRFRSRETPFVNLVLGAQMRADLVDCRRLSGQTVGGWDGRVKVRVGDVSTMPG